MRELQLLRHMIFSGLAVVVMGTFLMATPNRANAAPMQCNEDGVCVNSCDDPALDVLCSSCVDGQTLQCQQTFACSTGFSAFCARAM